MENKENITTTTGNGVNSIIDVRGIQIDISSVLKDVTNSIKNNLKTSFDDVLKDYELYKSTHDALLQIPFIKDLYNKNSELSLQVKTLKQQEEEGLKCEEDGEEHEPTITLNIHDSFIKNNDDEPFSLRADFFKINKMNKKQPENDFEIENSEEEEEAISESEEEAISEAYEEAADEEEEEEEEEESEKEESEKEESEAEEEESEAEEEESEAEEEEEEEESEAEEEAISEAADEEEEAEEEEAEDDELSEAEEEAEEEEEEAKEEEEEEQEQEEEEEEEEEEAEEEEEEEEEVFEILIKNVTYYTTNKQDGDIYSCVNNDVGEIVGKFKNGKPSFSKRK